MRRGDVYTAARGTYGGKPRPVIILQDDRFDAAASVTICPMMTHLIDAPLLHVAIDATPTSGLDQPSHLMVDKVTTVPRHALRDRLGRLSDDDLVRLDRALIVFLGLAD